MPSTMTDQTETSEQETQTRIHVFPHVLEDDERALVTCSRVCQTAVSMFPEMESHVFYSLLEFIPYKDITKDAIRIIDMPRKTRLQFKLPENGEDEDDIHDSSDRSSAVSESILKAAGRRYKLPTEAESRKETIESDTQTALTVVPHVLEENRIADVFADTTAQTSMFGLLPVDLRDEQTETETETSITDVTLDEAEETDAKVIYPLESPIHSSSSSDIIDVFKFVTGVLENEITKIVEMYDTSEANYCCYNKCFMQLQTAAVVQTIEHAVDEPNEATDEHQVKQEHIGDSSASKRFANISCECHPSGTGAAPAISPLHTPVSSATDVSQGNLLTVDEVPSKENTAAKLSVSAPAIMVACGCSKESAANANLKLQTPDTAIEAPLKEDEDTDEPTNVPENQQVIRLPVVNLGKASTSDIPTKFVPQLEERRDSAPTSKSGMISKIPVSQTKMDNGRRSASKIPVANRVHSSTVSVELRQIMGSPRDADVKVVVESDSRMDVNVMQKACCHNSIAVITAKPVTAGAPTKAKIPKVSRGDNTLDDEKVKYCPCASRKKKDTGANAADVIPVVKQMSAVFEHQADYFEPYVEDLHDSTTGVQTDLALGSDSIDSLPPEPDNGYCDSAAAEIPWQKISLPAPGTYIIRPSSKRKLESEKRRESDEEVVEEKRQERNPLDETLRPEDKTASSEEAAKSTPQGGENKDKSKAGQKDTGNTGDEPPPPEHHSSAQNVAAGGQEEESEDGTPQRPHKNLLYEIGLKYNEPYMEGMYKFFPDEDELCTSRTEIPWKDIVLQKNCLIRRAPKPDDCCEGLFLCTDDVAQVESVAFPVCGGAASQLTVSVTSTMSGMLDKPKRCCKECTICLESRSPSKHSCSNKKASEASVNLKLSASFSLPEMSKAKATKAKPKRECPANTPGMPCHKAEGCKNVSKIAAKSSGKDLVRKSSAKQDAVMAALEAYEAEMKPLKRALTELQNKIRGLNMPDMKSGLYGVASCTKPNAQKVTSICSTMKIAVAPLMGSHQQAVMPSLPLSCFDMSLPPTSMPPPFGKPAYVPYHQPNYSPPFRQIYPTSYPAGYAGSGFPARPYSAGAGASRQPQKSCPCCGVSHRPPTPASTLSMKAKNHGMYPDCRGRNYTEREMPYQDHLEFDKHHGRGKGRKPMSVLSSAGEEEEDVSESISRCPFIDLVQTLSSKSLEEKKKKQRSKASTRVSKTNKRSSGKREGCCSSPCHQNYDDSMFNTGRGIRTEPAPSTSTIKTKVSTQYRKR